jgi:glycosyltransferase involved in cell wall biosynthesis
MSAAALDRATGDPLAELMGSGELPRRREDPGPLRGGRRVASLSIVIPAKNEASGLGPLLDELHGVLADLAGIEAEILVIDDGSADGTGEVARARGARVVRHAESLGNGAAVKRGIREARCEWILLLDADGQHPPAAIPSLLAMAEEHDLVIASRGGRGGGWHRNLANRAYNALASYVTGRRIPDLTSGFRVLRADAAKGFVYLLPNTFSYPTTITLAMLRAGYSVGFVPFAVRERIGRSHIDLLRDGSRFFLIILRIATFVAPLRVFVPVSAAMAGAGLVWYAYTFFAHHRLTNMTGILLTQATVIFALGLISEQVAALRLDRMERRG